MNPPITPPHPSLSACPAFDKKFQVTKNLFWDSEPELLTATGVLLHLAPAVRAWRARRKKAVKSMAKSLLSGMGSNSRERNMNFIVRMAPTFIHGNRHDRVRVIAAVGVRFALGAFAVACFQHYVDPLVSVNLGSQYAPLVGGAAAAAIGTFVKSV